MRINLLAQPVADIKKFYGWKIWVKPKEIHQYAFGVDTAEGVNGDASCIQVLDCTNGEHVASYWSNSIDIDSFAAEVYKGGIYYNKAHICPESNNHGHALITHLSGALGGLMYPNLYKRIVLDEYTQKRERVIGFKTTAQTKPRIIENLKSALRDGDITLYDRQTLEELSTFSRTDRGKLAAVGNAKDDRVMALALAWEQARIIKENLKLTGEEYSFKQKYDEQTGFPLLG